MLILALLVVGSTILLAVHRTVPAQTPVHTATTSQTSTASQRSAVGTTCTLLPQEPSPQFATVEFKTAFSKHCVHYSEIFSGGPPKDGIPAINAPKFVSVSTADKWLKPNEPVIFFQVGIDARAYSIQILIWHSPDEIVNDT